MADFSALLEERKAAILDRYGLAEIVEKSGVKLTPKNGELSGLCPFHKERTPSFTVVESKGFYHCFGCGAHGDLFGYVQDMQSMTFKEALDYLDGGKPVKMDPKVRAERERREKRKSKFEAEQKRKKQLLAVQIWAECQAIGGSLAATYLGNRGLEFSLLERFLGDLRFSPKRRHPYAKKDLPAMVAGIRLRDRLGQRPALAIHQTFLEPDGSGKSTACDSVQQKLVLGSPKGGCIAFGPPRKVIFVGEGIETSLTILQCLLKGGHSPEGFSVWCAVSSGNFQSMAVPPGVERLIICGDGDSKNMDDYKKLLAKASAAQRDRGLKVTTTIAPRGFDFNDLLKKGKAA